MLKKASMSKWAAKEQQVAVLQSIHQLDSSDSSSLGTPVVDNGTPYA